jgi:hypothetical protein
MRNLAKNIHVYSVKNYPFQNVPKNVFLKFKSEKIVCLMTLFSRVSATFLITFASVCLSAEAILIIYMWSFFANGHFSLRLRRGNMYLRWPGDPHRRPISDLPIFDRPISDLPESWTPPPPPSDPRTEAILYMWSFFANGHFSLRLQRGNMYVCMLPGPPP